jgi:ATP-dependent protease ClpP protease subunit
MNKHTTKLSSLDFFESFGKVEPFQVLGTPTNMQYVVSVDEDFSDVKQFENIVHILENASKGDTLEIKLSTNGGALHSILPLLAAMKNTEAQVFVHAVSDVASAGTMIMMAADDVLVNEYCTIMMHQISFGTMGTGSSIESHVTHTMKSSKTLLQDLYKNFFTDDEIEQMLSGRDFWLGKEEFDERYDNRSAIRQEEMENYLEEIKEAAAKKASKGKKKSKKEIVEEF